MSVVPALFSLVENGTLNLVKGTDDNDTTKASALGSQLTAHTTEFLVVPSFTAASISF